MRQAPHLDPEKCLASRKLELPQGVIIIGLAIVLMVASTLDRVRSIEMFLYITSANDVIALHQVKLEMAMTLNTRKYG